MCDRGDFGRDGCASLPASIAQSTTDGAIGGLVADATLASLPGVTVTARNVATNSSAEATTDATGRFLIIRLQPGVYNVEISLTGFTPQKRDNTIVEVGRTTSLDVVLGVPDRPKRSSSSADAGHQHRTVRLLDQHQPDHHREPADQHAAAGRHSR